MPRPVITSPERNRQIGSAAIGVIESLPRGPCLPLTAPALQPGCREWSASRHCGRRAKGRPSARRRRLPDAALGPPVTPLPPTPPRSCAPTGFAPGGRSIGIADEDERRPVVRVCEGPVACRQWRGLALDGQSRFLRTAQGAAGQGRREGLGLLATLPAQPALGLVERCRP